MNDIFGMDFGLPDFPDEELEGNNKVSADELLRWASWTKPFPLPDYLTPNEPGCLSDVPDDVLLHAPPQLLAHLLRTGAQGGLQVISPRQTPITALMSRAGGTRRCLGDHVVGSVAKSDTYWPTIDGANMDRLLPDEPLPLHDQGLTLYQKTKTEPLTSAGHLLVDPILSCLIKGRAVVDILRRDDVSGGADALVELLSAAWGLEKETLLEMDAFTVGIDGPLLRHAIKVDEVFPMVHAAIHRARSVSVGAPDISRDLLPQDSAMDWRRMRVFCQAVYLMCCSIEGIPLQLATAYPPPGDPTAPLNRPNTMAFRPSPCTAWSYEAKSFSVVPVVNITRLKRRPLPPDVIQALGRYVKVIRPMSFAMTAGYRAKAARSVIKDPVHAVGETLSAGYTSVLRYTMVGSARGKTSARAVRNMLYESIANSPPEVQLRLTRYIEIAQKEVEIHLQLPEVPDIMIERIASRFLTIGENIRQRVLSEAAKRGATREEWWGDIIAQTPERYKSLTEGTMGWAKVAFWLAFKTPTDKWRKLSHAMTHEAFRQASINGIKGIALPAEIGSVDRLMAAIYAASSSLAKTYAGFYIAVSDVGMVMSDVANSMGKPRTAEICKEASYLWMLRARALRGMGIHPMEKEKSRASINHLRVFAEPVDIIVAPAPYRAFAAYQAHLESSNIMSAYSKRVFNEGMGTEERLSEVFRHFERPMLAVRDSVLTRYLVDPTRMANDMEKAWKEHRDDLRTVAATYGGSTKRKIETTQTPILNIITNEQLDLPDPMKRQKGPLMDYFEAMMGAENDEQDWFEDILFSLDDDTARYIYEGQYTGMPDLRHRMLEFRAKLASDKEAQPETVR